MTRNRLLLECSACGQGKLIDVVLSDDGVIGVVKCDECKMTELRATRSVRRPVRVPVEEPSVGNGQGPSDPPARGLRHALANVFNPAR